MIKFWNFGPAFHDEATAECGDPKKRKCRNLRIEGEIASESWFGDEITPAIFREELMSDDGDIDVYINSPGGDCIAASVIYTDLKEYSGGTVTVKICGLAASAASVIAMAGDRVLMAETAMMMVHDPSTCVFGNSDDMKKAIDVLSEFKASIVNAYEKKTGLARDKIERLMRDETWMNARKCIELGFADGIIADGTMTDSVKNTAAYGFSAVSGVRSLCAKLGASKHTFEESAKEAAAEAAEKPKESGNALWEEFKKKHNI